MVEINFSYGLSGKYAIFANIESACVYLMAGLDAVLLSVFWVTFGKFLFRWKKKKIKQA